jgi:hypothetical protein
MIVGLRQTRGAGRLELTDLCAAVRFPGKEEDICSLRDLPVLPDRSQTGLCHINCAASPIRYLMIGRHPSLEAELGADRQAANGFR